MGKYSIDYTEVYSKNYEVEANTLEEATEKLREDILVGETDGPDCCIDSYFEDVTEYKPKLVALTDTELNLLMECILTTLDQFDESKKRLCNTSAVDALEEQRKSYQNLILVLAESIDRK